MKSDLQRRVQRLRALIQNPDDTTPEQHARKSSDTSIAGAPSRRVLSEKSRWNRAKICTLGEIQGCFLRYRPCCIDVRKSLPGRLSMELIISPELPTEREKMYYSR